MARQSVIRKRKCRDCGDIISRAAPLRPTQCIGCYIAENKRDQQRARNFATPQRPALKMTRTVNTVAVAAFVPEPVKRLRRGPVKAKTAAEQRWMDRVAGLSCRVCGASVVELHHIREGQGAAQRAQHTLVLPLCPEHHRGASGVHGLGKRGFAARYRRDELDLLAETIEALA